MDDKIVISETKGYSVGLDEFKNNKFFKISKIWKRKDGTEWQSGKGYITFSSDSFDKVLEFLNNNSQEIQDYLKN